MPVSNWSRPVLSVDVRVRQSGLTVTINGAGLQRGTGASRVLKLPNRSWRVAMSGLHVIPVACAGMPIRP